ncbi:ATPase, T2SS/T4P/T4SS family [Isoptericola sp. F-RaC21]|uniref:CpaF family protein n=1 Tax=Isoptericola sp. F-RaC21 TaxID=3141452 RepID=UPI00315B99C0
MSTQPPDPSSLPIFTAYAATDDAEQTRVRRPAHTLAGPVDEATTPRAPGAAPATAVHHPPTVPVAAVARRAAPAAPPASVPPQRPAATPGHPAPYAPQRAMPPSGTGPAQVPAQTPTQVTAPAAGRADFLDQPKGVDWKQVAEFRGLASTRLAERLGEDRGKDLEAERELGRAIIQEILDDAAADLLHDGRAAWSIEHQRVLARAIHDSLFGLGRLQPLVDADDVENIIISPHDNAWVEKTTGELVKVDPVADSDQELRENLAFIATRSDSNARSFSPASPHLHMRLDDGSRLAAASWVTANTSVVIRRHRMRKVELDRLVELGMMSPVQASFLRAAVRAKKSIVVAGPQGAGKTTIVRALCAEIPRYEQIGTFETEFELHLHELPEVHDVVHAWEARPGSGEIGADGRQAGEFTLDEAIYNSFRFNLSRQIVGEVRGKEVWAMIKAMESGAGSISTTHAANGSGAIRKLVTCAMEAGPHVTRELATSKLAETVDLVVQVGLQTRPLDATGTRWQRDRWVSEIVHIAPGEEAVGYATTHVFTPNPQGGPAVPGTLPEELRDLERFGFDLTSYLVEGAQQGQGDLR